MIWTGTSRRQRILSYAGDDAELEVLTDVCGCCKRGLDRRRARREGRCMDRGGRHWPMVTPARHRVEDQTCSRRGFLRAPVDLQGTGIHSRRSSSGTSAKGSARTVSSPACVATMTQYPASRRSTSSVRATGSTSHV